jgi:hypothetical protein
MAIKHNLMLLKGIKLIRNTPWQNLKLSIDFFSCKQQKSKYLVHKFLLTVFLLVYSILIFILPAHQKMSK